MILTFWCKGDDVELKGRLIICLQGLNLRNRSRFNQRKRASKEFYPNEENRLERAEETGSMIFWKFVA